MDERTFYEPVNAQNKGEITEWFKGLIDDEKSQLISKLLMCHNTNYEGTGWKGVGSGIRELKTLSPNPGLRILCCPHPSIENAWIMVKGFHKGKSRTQQKFIENVKEFKEDIENDLPKIKRVTIEDWTKHC